MLTEKLTQRLRLFALHTHEFHHQHVHLSTFASSSNFLSRLCPQLRASARPPVFRRSFEMGIVKVKSIYYKGKKQCCGLTLHFRRSCGFKGTSIYADYSRDIYNRDISFLHHPYCCVRNGTMKIQQDFVLMQTISARYDKLFFTGIQMSM